MSAERPVILVADDEPALCKVLKLRLEMEGFEVIIAEDGTSALDSLRSRRPDVAVLDVMMPGLNGLEVVSEMKRDQDLSGIPVIILSARRLDREIAGALAAGADRYIAKPFDSQELMLEIRALLAG
ncbi:MAG: response regulator transcription factor [Candidatus Dormibacteria bacterium]